MVSGWVRAAAIISVVGTASFVLRADDALRSQSVEVQLQLGNEFLAEGRYVDSLDAFKRALEVAGPDDLRAARSGVIQAALRVAEFDLARSEAEKLVAECPEVQLFIDSLKASTRGIVR